MRDIHTSSNTFARTQIYLTHAQQLELDRLSKQSDSSKSELIRTAVDQFLAQQQRLGGDAAKRQAQKRAQGLQLLAGLWGDRADMADPAQYINDARKARF